jgi:hypothetical protein
MTTFLFVLYYFEASGPVENFYKQNIFCSDLSFNSFIQTLISFLNQPIV